MLISTFVHLKWDPVPGATKYEIVQTLPNGEKVKSTKGIKPPLSTKLAFGGGVKKVSVFDLPNRTTEQKAEIIGEIV